MLLSKRNTVDLTSISKSRRTTSTIITLMLIGNLSTKLTIVMPKNNLYYEKGQPKTP